MQTSLPAMAALALIVSAGSAKANFQYVPEGDSAASMAAPEPSVAPPTPIMRAPIRHAPPNTNGNSSGGAVINGFGNQVPLVIALREIVPSSYQFAFADGIDLGTLINWKGGKPWHDVLNSVVSPLGLTAVEKNMVIYIDRQQQ